MVVSVACWIVSKTCPVGDNSDLFGGHDYLMPVNRAAAGLPDEVNVKIDVHKDHGRFDLHDRTMIAVAATDLLNVRL